MLHDVVYSGASSNEEYSSGDSCYDDLVMLFLVPMQVIDMKTTRYTFLLFVLITLGCVSTGGYEEKLSGWVGGQVSEAIKELGSPHNILNMRDGTWIYTWEKSGGAVSTSIGGVLPLSKAARCTTTLIVNRRRVVLDYEFSGSACR